MNIDDVQLMEKIQKKIKEMNEHERKINKRYGYLKKIIQCNVDGNQFIAVGNRLMWDKNWVTFPDFLMDYIKLVLEKDWWEKNYKIQTNKHPIIIWHEKMLEFQKKQEKKIDGLYETEVNAAMLSYILLAHDLYTIAHNFELQKQVIKRLRINDQFQGARYELFVASTFMRAGFKIEYTDETDRSGKHPEFIAEIPETGQFIAVEAKCRHRINSNFKRNPISSSIKLGITNLINRALKKDPQKAFIIFIDLNLPYPVKNQHSNYKQLVSEYKKSYKKNPIDEKFNMIFFSDHNPCSLNDNSIALAFNVPIIAISKKPTIDIFRSDLVLSKLKKSISQFGNIPNSFSEMVFDRTIY